jgi:cationic amino acid transporter 14
MEQIKQRLMRTKTLISQGSFESDGAPLAAGLKKVLTTVDLVSLGVGSCVGTGVYVVAGMVAKNVAGPSAIFSFMLAAAASMLSGRL